MNILEELNPSQRAAVEYNEGPALVIAGAGSGKTRVLTFKIAYLLQLGYQPWSILALTFTNKAANEMKARIATIVGEEKARYLFMGTFHSIFARILRVEAAQLGFSSNFTIYDESDSRSLLKAIIKEMGLDDKVYKPALVHKKISLAKNKLILPTAYSSNASLSESDRRDNIPEMAKIYINYSQRCQKSNAMDFDDLLVYTFTLFQKYPDICNKYADRFDYVLVDEYQDTNYVQQQIVYMLTQKKRHLCVVGDDSQSIYSFRGADIDNILSFQQQYHNTELFKLEQNYRSTQNIVKAANSLIKKNRFQIEKEVFTCNSEGEKIQYRSAYSDKEEALIVCKNIKRIKCEDNCNYSDFAILYRTNSQSRSFEEELRKQNIPYKIYGGLSFYQRKEIKDIIAYYRLVANPDDEEALKRIINYPSRGIGDSTLAKISACAIANVTSFWDVISNPVRLNLDVNKGIVAKLLAFQTLIQSYIQRADKEDAYELGADIIKTSGINKDIYGDTSPEAMARQENVDEFLGAIQNFVEERREEGRMNEAGISDFLQEVALLTDIESEDEHGKDKVNLMTIHSSKGLEYGTVFIVGMEQNIFPSPQSASTLRSLEEERRLLYVALTRAERHCFLTSAHNRWRYGKTEFCTPSCFLAEIDSRFMSIEEGKIYERPTFDASAERFNTLRTAFSKEHSTMKLQDSLEVRSLRKVETLQETEARSITSIKTTQGRLSVGTLIEHQRFGLGKIVKLEGTGENQKATVKFENSGSKQLLLKFARFTIVK